MTMFRTRISMFCLTIILLGTCGVQTASASALWHHKPHLTGLDVAPHKVAGGSAAAVTATVTLSDPADTGGVVVTLSSSDTSVAIVPASVTIPAGATTASFPVTTLQVFEHRKVRIKGAFNCGDKEGELRVKPFDVESFSFNPSTLPSGSIFTGFPSTVGTVVISEPAGPAGVTVTLTSNRSGGILPTLTVLPGNTTVSFSLTPGGVTVTTVIKFEATIGRSHKAANLTITP